MDFRNELKNLNHNTIIYGHHVGNTMFDVLEDYLKQSFYENTR